MKKRYTWLLGAALVVGAVMLSAAAGASATALLDATSATGQQEMRHQSSPPPPPGPPRGPGGPRGLDPMLFELDLTAAQVEQIKALRDEARTASQPYEAQMRKSEEDIRTATQAGAFEEDTVRTLAAAGSKAMTELRVIQARTDAAIWKLLTKEQQASLTEMRQHQPGPHRHGPGEDFE